jgi:hypothetical protein
MLTGWATHTATVGLVTFLVGTRGTDVWVAPLGTPDPSGYPPGPAWLDARQYAPRWRGDRTLTAEHPPTHSTPPGVPTPPHPPAPLLTDPARAHAVIMATLTEHTATWDQAGEWWGCEAHHMGARTCPWDGGMDEFAAHQTERVMAALEQVFTR